MLQFFIQLFTFNKAQNLVKANATVLNVFETTRKSLTANNQKMIAHQEKLNAEILARQQQNLLMAEVMATNNNVIANIEKIFTTT